MNLIDRDALIDSLGISDRDIYCKDTIEEAPIVNIATTNEWASVKDGLPPVGEYSDWRTHVLALAGERVLEAYVNCRGTWSRASGASTKSLPPITHWQPLPDPPKEAEQ